MANKTYTIILNSAVATNVNTSAGISAYTYYVNWGSFLPKHVRTFSCKATFRSNKTTTEADTPDTAIVYANFGARTIYDQTNTMSQMVCIIQPDAYFITSATVRLYYFTAIAPQFMCPYPSNDFVTIRIKTLGGENTPSPPYIITFEFTEIENI